jgi:plasmid stabilization system protein ParE
MTLRWTARAHRDLVRLYEFLAPDSEPAAARAIQGLVAAADKLVAMPRLGVRLERFGPREVRRLLIGAYEIRYEVQAGAVILLTVWHQRERR